MAEVTELHPKEPPKVLYVCDWCSRVYAYPANPPGVDIQILCRELTMGMSTDDMQPGIDFHPCRGTLQLMNPE